MCFFFYSSIKSIKFPYGISYWLDFGWAFPERYVLFCLKLNGNLENWGFWYDFQELKNCEHDIRILIWFSLTVACFGFYIYCFVLFSFAFLTILHKPMMCCEYIPLTTLSYPFPILTDTSFRHCWCRSHSCYVILIAMTHVLFS